MWPVLVADLADAASRDFLQGLALAGGRAFLPLITAPSNSSTHRLEVYTPGHAEPLVLFAEPLGAPTAVGFPLMLRMYDAGEAPVTQTRARRLSSVKLPPLPTPAPESEIRARVPTSVTLTAAHTRDLSGELLEVEPEALVGRDIAGGKLRIESLIGAGGVGSVYRASHRDLRMSVAVKVLHEHFQRDLEFCRRFHAEALAASRLDHPNLMRVLDFGQESDGMLYLAMEHLDGVALADILHQGVGMPMPRVVDIMMQVCAGLAHAHSRGIVHRDIKPDNVVLVANKDDDERPSELVKVCDFGIAVQQADGVGETKGSVAGTPDYMSPEQCRGEQLDGRSDVYSCGVMLYELATGQMPFNAPSAVQLINRHMNVAPPSPRLVNPQIDRRLELVIMRALEKEPADRQQSMRDLRRELRALLAEAGNTPAPPSLAEPETGSRSAFVPPTAPIVEVNASPEWLERGGSYRHESSAEMPSSNVNGRLLAGELAARPAAWLSAFAETNRQDQFESLAGRLELALPFLIADRNVKALFAVRSTIDVLAADDPTQPGWRASRARSMQHGFADSTLLTFLAEHALANDTPAREVSELLLRAGPPAAYALYSCRLKHTDLPGIRRRFIAIITELGVSALPMIRAGLAKLELHKDALVVATLAADLLLASPRVRDAAAGDVTVPYLQSSAPALVRIAADALVAFWGERSTPFLLGLLGMADDAVRITCIKALRELRAIDEHAVTKIAFAARSATSAELRALARAALEETTGSTRVIAERALAQLASEPPLALSGTERR